MKSRVGRDISAKQPYKLHRHSCPCCFSYGAGSPESYDRASIACPESCDRASIACPESYDGASIACSESCDGASVACPELCDRASVAGPLRPELVDRKNRFCWK